jgi:hypothetical protein
LKDGSLRDDKFEDRSLKGGVFQGREMGGTVTFEGRELQDNNLKDRSWKGGNWKDENLKDGHLKGREMGGTGI